MNRTPTCTSPAAELAAPELSRLVSVWLMNGELSRHSPRTLELRRMVFDKVRWFLADRDLTACDADALRAFLAYVANGHRDPRGRWGNAANRRAAAPGTVATYARHLRAFFTWAVKDGLLDADPMARIPRVVDRPDDVRPFTLEQMRALLEAARDSREGERNYALLLFLADTACRVSEACALRWGDVDLSARMASVEGKGGKRRSVPFSATTGKALFAYVRQDGRDPADAVFESERGGPMNRNAVRLLFGRLKKAAGITGVRCSAHTVRHFGATEFLRNGGQAFALQRMLGHTTLVMTRRYTDVVDADVAAQHRQASPVEGLLRKGKA